MDFSTRTPCRLREASRPIKGFRHTQSIVRQIYRPLNLNGISDFICRLDGSCHLANTGDKGNKIDYITSKTSPSPRIGRIRNNLTYADGQ